MKQKLETPEEVGLSSTRLARIGPVMQAHVDDKQIAGMSTMIARKGKVIHFEQIGQMDIEAATPMSDDAIFRIYSMTKPIICTALMILFEQGRFHLTDPIAGFLPAFGKLTVLEGGIDAAKEAELVRPVTIRDLLTHTSGLTYDFLEDSPVAELYRQARLLNDASRSLAELVADLAQLPLAYQPGTRWHYSLSFDVAAHLIEVIADQPLRDFLVENLFTPLGMVDTDFSVPVAQQSRIAAMYGSPDLLGRDVTLSQCVDAWSNGFNERIDVSKTNPASPADAVCRGGAGLFSTAWDYMRFAQMLLNGGELDGELVLGRKTVELMHMNHLPTALLPWVLADPPAYGLGFGLGSKVTLNVADTQLPGSVGAFGWSGAAKTDYWVDPQEEMVGIFMSQSMMQFDLIKEDFHILAYQALTD